MNNDTNKHKEHRLDFFVAEAMRTRPFKYELYTEYATIVVGMAMAILKEIDKQNNESNND